MKKKTIYIERSIVAPNGMTTSSEIFELPFLNSKVIGAGVNNKTICDLKKKKRAEYHYSDGSKLVFEDVTEEATAALAAKVKDADMEMVPADAKP